jgi:DNA primase
MNIQQEKTKIDILQVIQKSGVVFDKIGINSFAKCPFHDEKTASFCVNGNKQAFHCFGCGVSGDVIEYVQKFYKLEFKAALQFLGITDGLMDSKAIYAVKRQRHQQKREQKTKQLKKQIQTWCDDFYADCLETIEAVEYALKKLTWQQVQEIANLVKRCSDYRYYIELLDNAFESKDFDTLYFVWEQNQ